MHKSDIIRAAAERAGLSQQTVRTALESVLAVMTEELEHGQRVTLTGFGSFEVRSHQARTVRHPQSQAKIMIPHRRRIAFVAGAPLIAKVRSTDTGDSAAS